MQKNQQQNKSEDQVSKARNTDSEQQTDQHANELPGAIQRVANSPKPKAADIITLQKGVGNRTVQRILHAAGNVVQRTFRTDPEYMDWRGQMMSNLSSFRTEMSSVDSHHNNETTSLESARTRWGGVATTWNAASVSGAGGPSAPPAAGSPTQSGGTTPEDAQAPGSTTAQ